MQYIQLQPQDNLDIPQAGDGSINLFLDSSDYLIKLKSDDNTVYLSSKYITGGTYTSGGTITLFNNDGSTSEITGFSSNIIYDLGNISGNTNVDLSNNKLLHKMTLVGDVNIALQNPYVGNTYKLIINQTLGGELTTWPSNVIWVNNKKLTILSGLDSVVDSSFSVTGITSYVAA